MGEQLSLQERREKFQNIIQLIQQNTHDGLELFYTEYSELIYTTVKAFCRNKTYVDDIVNDLVLKINDLVKERPEMLKEKTNPEGWLYTVTRNYTLDFFRKRRTVPLKADIPSNRDEIQELIDNDSFNWYIKDLSKEEKEIAILRYVARETYQDIADFQQKPTSTVASKWKRAIQKILKFLEKNA